MKLSAILIISFILMGLVGSLGGTYYYYSQSNILLEEKAINHLKSTAQHLENFITKFLEEQEDKIKIAATHSDLTNEELKVIRDSNIEFYEVFVLDSTGKIIASSDESQIGKDKSNDDYFINARDKTYLKPAYLSKTTQKQAIAVATPFNEGVLVARIELQAFDNIITDRTGLGETGESLLGYNDENGEAIFFTEKRFEEEEEEEEEEKHDLLPMHEALNENEDIFLDLYDYRHVNVISVTKYIEEIDVGLVVKIDEAESFGVARNQLIRTSIIIIIAISILFSIIGFFISRWISKPLNKMSSDVDEITKGKLDMQLSKSGIKEVQVLTDSLNRILASLKLAILKTGGKGGLGLGEAIKGKEEAEEIYKALYESSRDAIMILEPPTWNFTTGNPATIKMFGAKDEAEFTSKNPGELSPEKQPDGQPSGDKAKKMIMKAVKTGSNSFEWTHKKISGEEFPAHVLLTRMKLEGKDVLQATVRDLSKKQKKKSLDTVVKRTVKSVKKQINGGKKVAPVKKKIVKANNKKYFLKK